MNEKTDHMKYLKIYENKGYFLKDKEQPTIWTEIDQIEKNDILNLLNHAVDGEFEIEEYVEANIANKAHQIIYKHLTEKIINFLDNKDKFKDEAEGTYKDAFEKYQ